MPETIPSHGSPVTPVCAVPDETLSSLDDVTYDAETGETVATFDPETETHSIVVVDLVGAREGCDPTELTPLYEAVDPEVLDALLDSCAATRRLSVSFRYGLYDVTVRPGTVSVRPVA